MNVLADRAIKTSYAVWRIWIISYSDLDRTHSNTEIAVRALPFDFHPHQADAIKERIDCSQRAERSAKRPARNNKEHEEAHQDTDLHDIEPADHVRLDHRFCIRWINRIPQHPRNAGAERAPRTDPREPMCLNKVWQDNRENDERNVLPLFQEGGDSEFPALDLEDLILDPTEWTQPSAHRSSKRHADDSQEADYEQGDLPNR